MKMKLYTKHHDNGAKWKQWAIALVGNEIHTRFGALSTSQVGNPVLKQSRILAKTGSKAYNDKIQEQQNEGYRFDGEFDVDENTGEFTLDQSTQPLPTPKAGPKLLYISGEVTKDEVLLNSALTSINFPLDCTFLKEGNEFRMTMHDPFSKDFTIKVFLTGNAGKVSADIGPDDSAHAGLFVLNINKCLKDYDCGMLEVSDSSSEEVDLSIPMKDEVLQVFNTNGFDPKSFKDFAADIGIVRKPLDFTKAFAPDVEDAFF